MDPVVEDDDGEEEEDWLAQPLHPPVVGLVPLRVAEGSQPATHVVRQGQETLPSRRRKNDQDESRKGIRHACPSYLALAHHSELRCPAEVTLSSPTISQRLGLQVCGDKIQVENVGMWEVVLIDQTDESMWLEASIGECSQARREVIPRCIP